MSTEEHREPEIASPEGWEDSFSGVTDFRNYALNKEEVPSNAKEAPNEKNTFLKRFDNVRHSYKFRKFREEPKTLLEIATLLVLLFYTYYTAKMYSANNVAANAAKTQAETLQKQLELTDRAWIKIADVQPTDDSGAALDFGDPSRPPYPVKKFVQLSFEIDERNTGHSAALDIQTTPELYLMKTTDSKSTLGLEALKFCDSNIGSHNTWRGGVATMFPDEPSSIKYSLPGIKSDIAEDSTFRTKGEALIHISPVLIVCVDYRYQSSVIRHHTRAVYELLRPFGNHWIPEKEIGSPGNPATPFFEMGKVISAQALKLRRIGSYDFVD